MSVAYPVREPNGGEVIAVHIRHESPDGSKRFTWELPDGTVGLNGLRVADLPMFGAAAAHRWDPDEPVIVTEGEKAAGAVVKASYQAVGTVTGAAGCPSRESLMVLAGMAVLLWPDNDDAGRMHMHKIADVLGEPGEIAASIGWITWHDAPLGGDPADAFALGGSRLIDALIANAGDVPMELSATVAEPSRRREVPATVEPSRRRQVLSSESPIERFNNEVSVSTVLARAFGLEARPGRVVRCPRHDDRSPSLSILPDDRRAYCHSPSCEMNNNGRGRDAWDLHQMAEGVPA